MNLKNTNFEGQELLTSNGFNINDNENLKEKFLNQYANRKGWDINNLSDEQLNEIKSQKGYKCPGLICE